MRNLCWLVIVLGAAAFGQEDIPTFQTETTLVEFSVVALDRKGNPVTDLTKEEIEVTDKGRRREVAFFRFEGEPETREAAPLAEGEFTNRAEYTTGPLRNITAIVLDTEYTDLEDQMYFRSLALRYLQEIPPDTRIGVYRIGWGGAQCLHDFSDDVESLSKAISEDYLGAPRQIDELGRTLPSLEWIGDLMAGIPGRKSMVWISGGISDRLLPRKDGVDPITRVARRLASQGIAVYGVDAVGLKGMVDVSEPISWRSPGGGVVRRDLRFALQYVIQAGLWKAMDILASTTGGRATRNSNNLTRGIEEAAADVRGSYTVGFYVDDAPDDKWYRIKVKTSRKGVKLTHPEGYVLSVPTEEPQMWTEKEWTLRIANPVGATEIHLNGHSEPAEEEGAYNLSLEIAADELGFVEVEDRLEANLEVAVAEKTAAGDFSFKVHLVRVELLGDREAPSAGTLARAELGFQLEPDTVLMRVVARDRNTDRCGTLDLPVDRLPVQAQ